MSESILTAPPVEYLMAFNASPTREIAHIKPDGTVVLSEPGADREAARLFWDSIQFRGTTLIVRIRELETRLAKHEPVEPFKLV